MARAIEAHRLRKGKLKCLKEPNLDGPFWNCMIGDCHLVEAEFESNEAWLNHVRSVRGEPKWKLFSMKRAIEQEKEIWRDGLAISSADNEAGPSGKRVRVR